MKWLFVLLTASTFICSYVIYQPTNKKNFFQNSITNNIAKPKKPINENEAFVKQYSEKLKPFLNRNNYAADYFFLINMKIASGKKRFFVIDLLHDSIVESGLVTHGSGSHCLTDSLRFSNTPNSLATSLGMYKIGKEYEGKFGTAFKLHGLEPSNSNAFNRFVVLHAHSCVPAYEVYPSPICESWGCPTVNADFLQTLKKYINNSHKPMVLWIIY